MSLGNALSNSTSGLNAAARGLRTVSDNVANATTVGYVRRELSVTSDQNGGVKVGVDQRADAPRLTAGRRIADADAGSANTRATGLGRVADSFGAPGSDQTLSAKLAKLDSALRTAALTPENRASLELVTDAASDMSNTIVGIAEQIQAERQAADQRIAMGVEMLNDGISDIERLNSEIVVGQAQGRDVAGLRDERASVLDSLSPLVPLRVVEREAGNIAVFTMRGAALLDGIASEITFDNTPNIALGQTVTTLVTLNGQPDAAGLMNGGSLGAAINIRDDDLIGLAADLDSFTTTLVERFETADPLRGTGPGLFAIDDLALPAIPPDYVSLRIGLAPQFDAARGGSANALRDPSLPETDGSRLLDVRTALTDGTPRLESLAIELSISVSTDALHAEQALASSTALQQAAVASEQGMTGVDTDREMQNLLRYETAYAANIRVIAAVDEMLQRLMEI